jgi:choline dehydrogenase-like flavoprotein
MSAQGNTHYDAIVVGSGPGGASVARQLARGGKRVLILEQGSAAPLAGTLSHMARIAAVPGRGAFLHSDASLLVQGVAVGGSSTVNFATAADPPAPLFAAHGIDLASALRALRAELPIGPLPDSLVGPMATRIMQGARAIGMDWRKLDKMIRPDSCRSRCWRCAYGCPFGAKWSAREFIDQALGLGATLHHGASARQVLLKDGKAAGVAYVQHGKQQLAHAALVVLAGGGLGSPRLLHASGLWPRSSAFFSDPVVAVMGSVDDIDGGAEVPMATGLRFDEQGISLADLTLPRPMYQGFTAQVGRLDRLLAHRRTLSIMVKIRDQIGGSVGPHWADKRLQPGDTKKLADGVAMARAVLAACGARHVFKSWHFAAHPGGSVRIGEGVDSNLQTSTPNLYVCDASVIPQAWGLPPTLTLLSLGVRLGEHLTER